jgi:hypothetical protein
VKDLLPLLGFLIFFFGWSSRISTTANAVGKDGSLTLSYGYRFFDDDVCDGRRSLVESEEQQETGAAILSSSFFPLFFLRIPVESVFPSSAAIVRLRLCSVLSRKLLASTLVCLDLPSDANNNLRKSEFGRDDFPPITALPSCIDKG